VEGLREVWMGSGRQEEAKYAIGSFWDGAAGGFTATPRPK